MIGKAHSKAMRWARTTSWQSAEKRPGFYGGIVGDDHARTAGDGADAGDNPRGGNVAPFLVHVPAGPKANLEELCVFVEQKTDALSHRQSAHLALTFMARFAAAFAQWLLPSKLPRIDRVTIRWTKMSMSGTWREAGLIRGGA